MIESNKIIIEEFDLNENDLNSDHSFWKEIAGHEIKVYYKKNPRIYVKKKSKQPTSYKIFSLGIKEPPLKVTVKWIDSVLKWLEGVLPIELEIEDLSSNLEKKYLLKPISPPSHNQNSGSIQGEIRNLIKIIQNQQRTNKIFSKKRKN